MNMIYKDWPSAHCRRVSACCKACDWAVTLSKSLPPDITPEREDIELKLLDESLMEAAMIAAVSQGCPHLEQDLMDQGTMQAKLWLVSLRERQRVKKQIDEEARLSKTPTFKKRRHGGGRR